jgi:hypothetical protein
VGVTRALALLAAATIPGSASAHHSAVIFDTTSIVVLSGTVTRFDWTNPHVYIYVETRDDTGAPIEWQVETDAIAILTRSGWSSDVLAPGDQVTVRGNPDRDPQRDHVLLISLGRDDGSVLMPRAGGRAAPVRATSIFGVWDALRGIASRRFVYGALTEKAEAAKAQYSESQNPVIDCVAYPLPTIVAAPYLNELQLSGETIIFRTEFFNVERTIHMDGRGHPENGERTNQGHSIGWWEDDVLVVDTTLLADNRAGNRAGIPSGAQKHVLETYRLSEDGTRLLVEFIVEDPEYLAEPMTGGIEWDYAPDRELSRIGCDPEIARRYAFE